MGVEAFKEQKKHLMTDEIMAMPIVKYESVPDIDNTEKYNWVQVGTEKYGRTMYCTKTKIRRSLTMGEFYGTGIVD